MSRRFLFCVPTSQLSGGVKVVLQLTDRLVAAGHAVDLFSYAGPPTWHEPAARFLDADDITDVDMAAYDFVVVTNAMFIPIVLPRLGHARCVFLAQDYESFHHAQGEGYEDFMAETPAMAALYRLPVPIVTISRPLVEVIRERSGREPHYAPVGIDKDVFSEQPRRSRDPSARRRILLIGNYLMPYKGMSDGLEALRQLSEEIDVELVLITQEHRGREFFARCSYPVELHFCPAEIDVPPIIGSCDVYCCTSWYEGLGLPAIEAFHCGTPVVSTRTIGVGDYAQDGVNLLLAGPNAPDDLAAKLRAVLSDDALAERLRAGGLATARSRFDWADCAERFLRAIEDLDRTRPGPGDVDPAMLDGLLADLEREGGHTPIAVFHRFEMLAAELAGIEDALRDGDPPQPGQLARLATVRDGLAEHLYNPHAQYHSAFRAAHDRCCLLLELAGSPDTLHYVPLMVGRDRQTRPRSHAPALTERRYTNP
jgi:glycosyltransferase involved in cell wall biosynthesis